jgi:hypothetical protein
MMMSLYGLVLVLCFVCSLPRSVNQRNFPLAAFELATRLGR